MLSKDNDWNIDTSAGVPILVYKNCSVIESEQAEYILQLINNEVETTAEILSLREQYKSQSNELTAMTAAAQALRDEMYKCDAKLDALAALSPVAWRNRFTGYLHSNKPDIVDDFYDELFTAAKPVIDQRRKRNAA
ncbi:hypothetical protein [Yersinia similis]|uniref:Phage-like protein n=1 Tax=Yersinia similis TaxID=367190 RepID=A0A0T9PRV5_9GAMM|nr:hypothetical protein [Yersinia similis]CNG03769.1 Uncharacterised protein [Yersinia similis]CNH79127.1 Uncharacterised protein [Yersinia similis]